MAQIRSLFNKLIAKFNRIKDRVMQNALVRFLLRVIAELTEHDGTNMAAGVAFYVFLSIFPLLLGLIGLLGIFLPSETVQEQIFTFIQNNVPGATDIISNNIRNIINFRGALGVIGIVGLLWSGSNIVSAGGHAINRAWNIQTEMQFYLKKPRDIGLTIGLGLLFVLSLSASAIFSFVPVGSVPLVGNSLVQAFLFIVSYALVFVVFLMLFKVMPNTKTYWRHIWPGAFFTATLFVIGRAVFFFYINNFGDYQQVYGAVGSVIAVLLFIYYSAIIIILGAEVTSEYSRLRRGIGRGGHSHPTAQP